MRGVVGAYHVATFPGWRVIVEAQCRRLDKSGLLNRTSRLLVGVVGDYKEDISLLTDLLGQNASISRLGPLQLFEFPTINWLYEEIKNDDVACWYAHTKGASAPSDCKTNWRLKMESIIFDQHERCLDILKEYDTCGPDWMSTPMGNHFHAGNFWWANSRYLQTLPPPMSVFLNKQTPLVGPPSLAICSVNFGRVEAELWIGRNVQVNSFSIKSGLF